MIALRRNTHAPADGARAGGRPLYAIGDVHGCYDLLQALLTEISRDAAARYPDTTPILILCGDYVDRGPDSARVLAALAWLARSSAIEAQLLEGNHEAMLLDFLEKPTDNGEWLAYGGIRTLLSYGVEVPPLVQSEAELIRLRDGLLDTMPVSHHHLLHSLQTMVQVGDYAFVHAGVMPGVPLKKQRRHDLLWIRDEFLDDPEPADAVIVHGHSWVDHRPVILPQRIGIDTGAYKTHVLTAVRIADDEIEVIQASREGDRDGASGTGLEITADGPTP